MTHKTRKINKTFLILTTLFSLIICPIAGNAKFLSALDNLTDSTQSSGAVSATTAVKKSRNFSGLRSWYEKFSENQISSNILEQSLNGYETLSFNLFVEGTEKRGIALDFGKYVLIRTTTDLTVTDNDLLKEAEQAFNISLKSQIANLSAQDTCQCVWYARSKVPSLPTGLWNLNDKKAVINHLFPQGDGGSMSSVAVHNIFGDVGHVSVVTGVAIRSDGNLRVYITEKNYSPCAVTTRDGTMEALKIIGYFDPRYPVPSSFPNIISATNSTGKTGIPFTVSINGSGFDPSSMSAVIMGGNYCTTFYSCVIPNNHLMNKTSSSVKVPLTLNSPGNYRLYLFNANQGKTTFGQPITVSNP